VGAPSEHQSEPHVVPQSAVPRRADRNLHGFLASNADIVARIAKPARIGRTRALPPRSRQPVVFEDFGGKPGFRSCDTPVKNRAGACPACRDCPTDPASCMMGSAKGYAKAGSLELSWQYDCRFQCELE
jgi:hypothetical protein